MSGPSAVAATELAALLALACHAAAPAAADPPTSSDEHPTVRRVADPVGDIWAPRTPNTDDYAPLPDRTIGDVTELRVVHRGHRVVLRLRATSLTRPVQDPYEAVLASHEVVTPRHDYYALLVAGPTRGVIVGREGREPTRCRGARSEIAWDRGTVVVSVPRRCLGDPRWVRVGSALAYSWPGGGDGDFFIDGVPGSGSPVPGQASAAPSRRAWHPGE